MIRYICACGHKGMAPEGQIKYCAGCGAGVTLGAVVKGHAPALTMAAVKKAALRYLGQGDDAPLLTDMQRRDRTKHLAGVLQDFKVERVADLKEGDWKRFMDVLRP